MMRLPTLQCREALLIADYRANITALAACFPLSSEVQSIANEAIPCALTLFQLMDIFNRELNAALCFIQSSGENCNWPSECPTFVVRPLNPSPGMNLYDGRARGFYFPDFTTTNGGIQFSPFTDNTLTYFPMSFLETILFDNLHDVGGDIDCIGHPVLLSFKAATLVSVGGHIVISSDPTLATIDFSSLATVGSDIGMDGVLIGEANFPSLTTIGGSIGISSDALTSVDFPLLSHVGANFSLQGPALTSYRLPSLTSLGGPHFGTEFSALDVTTVNYLLVLLDSIKGTFLAPTTINLSGGTSAAPTGAGATAKASLITAGNTVLTN